MVIVLFSGLLVVLNIHLNEPSMNISLYELWVGGQALEESNVSIHTGHLHNTTSHCL